MTKVLTRQLTIKDGIGLGIGSIMGSGILFLPSFSYGLSGADVLIAWVLTTIFCLPLLIVFSDMVRAVPNEHGVEGFLELGLGKHIAAGLPILLLGTVCIGMPSAALIAGRYVSRYLNVGNGIAVFTALCLVALATATNIFGIKTGSFFQRWVAFLLFIVGGGLFFTTIPEALPKFGEVTLTWNWSAILAGSVIAFWASAGFENMTFMAGEFKNPHRDILVSIAVSLLLCGALYIGLTANVVALIPRDEVNNILGLYQLAESVQQRELATALIVLFALGAVAINLSSWCWGVSRLVYASAASGALPAYFHNLSDKNVPKRALVFLLCVFSTVIFGASLLPEWFERGLQVVSTNFVVLYLLCILSYTVYSNSNIKKLLGGTLIIALLAVLTSSGWMVLYPVGLVGVAAIRSVILERKRVRKVVEC
jgi:amino acid efflux transporter